MARVTLSFDAWKDGQVAPITVDVPVSQVSAQEAAKEPAGKE